MGIAGAGKSRLAESYVERGYERLNRDTIGGTLDGIAQRLAERLAAGARRIVLDNTYVTRASRTEVLRLAHHAGAAVTCVHLETPTHDAQVNVILRMLERHGRLLGGTELKERAKNEAGLFGPNVLFQMERQLEPPAPDEGFSSIQTLPFIREHTGETTGAAIPLDVVLDRHGELRAEAARVLAHVPSASPLLVFGHQPGIDESWRGRALARVASIAPGRIIELGVCAHANGAPVCWCRPPLPGLWVEFARRHAIDPRASLIVTASSAHRTMAKRLGTKSLDVAELG